MTARLMLNRAVAPGARDMAFRAQACLLFTQWLGNNPCAEYGSSG